MFEDRLRVRVCSCLEVVMHAYTFLDASGDSRHLLSLLDFTQQMISELDLKGITEEQTAKVERATREALGRVNDLVVRKKVANGEKPGSGLEWIH